MKICRYVVASDDIPERQWNLNVVSDDMGLMGVRNYVVRNYVRSYVAHLLFLGSTPRPSRPAVRFFILQGLRVP